MIHSKGFITNLNICLPIKKICLNGFYNPFVNKQRVAFIRGIATSDSFSVWQQSHSIQRTVVAKRQSKPPWTTRLCSVRQVLLTIAINTKVKDKCHSKTRHVAQSQCLRMHNKGRARVHGAELSQDLCSYYPSSTSFILYFTMFQQ